MQRHWRKAWSNLTLLGACANIQPTRRPLIYAQNKPIYTPGHTAARRFCQREIRDRQSMDRERVAREDGAMGTSQE